jgi:hypothetical protein
MRIRDRADRLRAARAAPSESALGGGGHTRRRRPAGSAALGRPNTTRRARSSENALPAPHLLRRIRDHADHLRAACMPQWASARGALMGRRPGERRVARAHRAAPRPTGPAAELCAASAVTGQHIRDHSDDERAAQAPQTPRTGGCSERGRHGDQPARKFSRAPRRARETRRGVLRRLRRRQMMNPRSCRPLARRAPASKRVDCGAFQRSAASMHAALARAPQRRAEPAAVPRR